MHYRVNSSHEATMRITRNHDPLNVMVYEKFKLKTLRFIEWLEVITKAKKLGLPPPPELAHFGKPAEDRKRKRTKILHEVFVKENIVVDRMHINLIPPLGVVGSREFHLATTAQLIRQQSAIQRATPEAKEMIKKLKLTIEARDDVIKGLSECKASERNIRRIQVKDIVKKVKDYLKTYSSAGMDINWSAVSISCPDKFSCKLDSLIKFTCSKGNLTLSFNLCDP
ncbi:hypothetical protein Tco_0098118 [Tanacetum coccineum]